MSRIPTWHRWTRDPPPRLVRRFYLRMSVLPFAFALIVHQMSNMDLIPLSWGLPVAPITIVGSVLLGLLISALWLWERRLMQRLRAADYKLCPQCGFVLMGHKGSFNCPECGEACDLARIQTAWRSFHPMTKPFWA
ncbi:MAG: hypothetical protein IID28_04115 [Planctomycetes bacterium]|nr:hypothetical protein [Planctomycetota bacterium]